MSCCLEDIRAGHLYMTVPANLLHAMGKNQLNCSTVFASDADGSEKSTSSKAGSGWRDNGC
jgi:hypothetical protein